MKKKEIKYNYDPQLGEFLSRKGVEEVINRVKEEERIKAIKLYITSVDIYEFQKRILGKKYD